MASPPLARNIGSGKVHAICVYVYGVEAFFHIIVYCAMRAKEFRLTRIRTNLIPNRRTVNGKDWQRHAECAPLTQSRVMLVQPLQTGTGLLNGLCVCGHNLARIIHLDITMDDINSLRRILGQSHVIAIVGLSSNWWRPSFFWRSI